MMSLRLAQLALLSGQRSVDLGPEFWDAKRMKKKKTTAYLKRPKEKPVELHLRLPLELAEAIRKAATRKGVSLNAEIVYWLASIARE
jgi:predicted HicB family RNase H-like nuclease